MTNQTVALVQRRTVYDAVYEAGHDAVYWAVNDAVYEAGHGPVYDAVYVSEARAVNWDVYQAVCVAWYVALMQHGNLPHPGLAFYLAGVG